MFKQFNEAGIHFYASRNNLSTKRGNVFYNPMMIVNRDFSVAIINALTTLNNKRMRILDLMAASGVRALRFSKSCVFEELVVNDVSKECVGVIKRNFKLNKIKNKRIKFCNESANNLLLRSSTFDYIQVDPFENIHKFLDLSLRKLKNNGILALTTTDTASLSGTYPKTCLRRYSSLPFKYDFKHEFGIRILVKDLQRLTSKQDSFLEPLLCYHYKHHYGLFLRKVHSKRRANESFKNHKYLIYCKKCLNARITNSIFNSEKCPVCGSKLDFFGRFYTGSLWDRRVLSLMLENFKSKEAEFSRESFKLLSLIYEESSVETPYTINTHLIAKKYSLKPCSVNLLVESLKKDGFKASRTHFNNYSIRTNASIVDIVRIMKEC